MCPEAERYTDKEEIKLSFKNKTKILLLYDDIKCVIYTL